MQKLNSLQGNWPRLGALSLVSILVIIVDQLSKLSIRYNLAFGESLPEEGIFRLTFVSNKGAIFGLSVPQVLPLIFSVLVIIAAVLFCYKYQLFSSRLAQTALGLLVGGSIGNVVDRIHLGYVVDFIDIRLWGDFHWPAFNVADAAIVVGAVLLAYFFVYSWKLQKHS
jgi:signal peptidase II